MKRERGDKKKKNVCARCGTQVQAEVGGKHTPWLCVVQCVDNGNHCLPSMQMNIYSFSKLLHVVYVHELTSQVRKQPHTPFGLGGGGGGGLLSMLSICSLTNELQLDNTLFFNSAFCFLFNFDKGLLSHPIKLKTCLKDNPHMF